LLLTFEARETLAFFLLLFSTVEVEFTRLLFVDARFTEVDFEVELAVNLDDAVVVVVDDGVVDLWRLVLVTEVFFTGLLFPEIPESLNELLKGPPPKRGLLLAVEALELLVIPPVSVLRCLFPANKTCFSASADLTRVLDCDVIDKRWLDLKSLFLITELLLILFSLFLTAVGVGVVDLEIFLSALLFKVFPFLVARTAEDPFVRFEFRIAGGVFELKTADELFVVFAL